MSGQGSGIIVSEDGLIVTAARVVQNARLIMVMVSGSAQPQPARVVSFDPDGMYAFLRVVGPFPQPARLAPPSDSLEVGQGVWTLGYPVSLDRVDPESAPGVVSGAFLEGSLRLAIAANLGSEGGPVADADGRVRGILLFQTGDHPDAADSAVALSISAFHDAMARILADASHLEGEEALTSADQRRLVAFAASLATEGNARVRTAEDLEAAAKSTVHEDDVLSRAASLPGSATAQLLAAGYFWNRYVLATLQNDARSTALRGTARGFADAAARLAPELRANSQLVTALLADAAPGASGAVPGWAVTGVAPTGSSRLTFQTLPGSQPLAVYVRSPTEVVRAASSSSEESSQGQARGERCTAPCRTDVEGGPVEIGVGRPGSEPSEVRAHTVDGPVLVRSYFKSRRAIRIAGGISGSVMAASGPSTVLFEMGRSGCGDFFEGGSLFCPRPSVLALGLSLLALGVGTTIFTLNQRDTLTVNISPQVTTTSGGVEVGGSF